MGAAVPLLETLDEWTSIQEEGKPVDALYLDFSKAFNSVPHQCLLLKLLSCASLQNMAGLGAISSGQTSQIKAKIEAGLRNVWEEAGKSEAEIRSSWQLTGAGAGQPCAHERGTRKHNHFYEYVENDEITTTSKATKNDDIESDENRLFRRFRRRVFLSFSTSFFVTFDVVVFCRFRRRRFFCRFLRRFRRRVLNRFSSVSASLFFHRFSSTSTSSFFVAFDVDEKRRRESDEKILVRSNAVTP